MKNSYNPDDAIAAIATPLAPAALGILRVSGSNAVLLVSHFFSRPKALNDAKGNTLVYGWIIDPDSGKKIDEVMIGVYRAPKSFTGEEMAEIFCHGGTAGITAMYRLILQNGFRAAERGEFTFRAFINGKTGLTEAEAVREIIDAKTDESLRRAANRLNGNLHGEIVRVKDQIIRTLAALEAQAEYPEDEETISGAFNHRELVVIEQELERLAVSWSAEKLYQDGAKAVLCGRTNAGKSSLFNALLKEERAIVSDIHGTTRDWLENWVSFDGVPVRLFDTAGLRETTDIIEKQGVERTKNLAEDADIILYAADLGVGLEQTDFDFLSTVPPQTPLVIIWNKADKFSAAESAALTAFAKLPPTIKTALQNHERITASAKTSSGIPLIIEAVKKALLPKNAGENTQAGLGSARQKKAVEEALQSVRHAMRAPKIGFSQDAVIQDLEDALSGLAEITGEITSDDILESIFTNFCVGK